MDGHIQLIIGVFKADKSIDEDEIGDHMLDNKPYFKDYDNIEDLIKHLKKDPNFLDVELEKGSDIDNMMTNMKITGKRQKTPEKNKNKNISSDEDTSSIEEENRGNKYKPSNGKGFKMPKDKKSMNYSDSDLDNNSEKTISKASLKKRLAPSPYILFCKEKKPGLKIKYPNITFGETGKKLSEMWEALDSKEKRKYIDESTRLKKEFEDKDESESEVCTGKKIGKNGKKLGKKSYTNSESDSDIGKGKNGKKLGKKPYANSESDSDI